jgi:MYXO-CTERM domain-containing protein
MSSATQGRRVSRCLGWVVLAGAVAAGRQAAAAPGAEPAAGPAVEEAASKARPDFRPDGSVVHAGDHHASVADYLASAAFRDQGGRCATPPPRASALFATPTDCSNERTGDLAEYAASSTLVIPVVFHVIQRTDGTGAIAPALIHSQIEVLNEDFGALSGSRGEAGVETGIRFVLATTDPAGQPTTGIQVVTRDDWFTDPGGSPSPMKQALAWDPRRYLNIYTNDAAGNLGYAYLPPDMAGQIDDGVVLLYASVGKNAPAGGDYALGRTATHEVGHYLGLFHTFDGGCGSAGAPYTSGDLLGDTTAHAEPNYECAPAPTACGAGQAPIDNYMNYTPDACMTGFSAEQAGRMRCSIRNYRPTLASSNAAPTAAFDADPRGLTVSFTDRSSDPDDAIASHRWDFGDGQGSSESDPVHTYEAAGTYEVTLVVADETGGTARATQSITVTAGGGAADGSLLGGCQTGGGAGLGGLAALGLAALAFGRRRRAG